MPIKSVPNLLAVPDPRKGEIFFYVRPGGRTPGEKFLDDAEKKMRGRFHGSFGALMRSGSQYCAHERFKRLRGAGEPLWEFKEHDHRLYCVRECIGPEFVRIVLLNGWVKDKTRGRQEDNEIATAKNLYREYMSEGAKK